MLFPDTKIFRFRPGGRSSHPAAGLSVLLVLVIIMLTSKAFGAPAAEEAGITAELTRGITTKEGYELTTSGSAYIEPGQGLRVNESGTNLLVNPGFETGIHAWRSFGNVHSSWTSPGVMDSSSAMKLVSYEADAGVSISSAWDGVSISSLDAGDVYTFSIHVKTAASGNSARVFLEGDRSGVTRSEPVMLTNDWHRLSVSKTVGEEDTVLVAGIITEGSAEAPFELLADAALLEKSAYLSTYFDGSYPGSEWMGSPHDSGSIRQGGHAYISGANTKIDLSEQFWFAIDVTLGFNSDDPAGDGADSSFDFINIGVPAGDGSGMLANEGVIIDYWGVSGNLTFAKLNEKGAVLYQTGSFKTGDSMKVVAAYDPETGMEMWAQIGERGVFHGTDNSVESKTASVVGDEWKFSVSDSGAWYANGDYQSNSLHRNLVVKQGSISAPMAARYIEDPAAFSAACNEKPALSRRTVRTYWKSMEDYTARVVSVDFAITNNGSGPAYDVTVLGGAYTNGVSLHSSLPIDVSAEIVPSGSQLMTLKYTVPDGVNSFKTTTHGRALDICGYEYYYPDTLRNP